MYLKTLLVALAVVCAVQAEPESEYVNDVFNKLNTFFESSKLQFAEMTTKVEKTVAYLDGRIEERLREIQQTLEKEMKAAREKANQKGVEVAECFSEEDKIPVIMKEILETTLKCVGPQKKKNLNKALFTIRNFIAKITRFVEMANEILKNCEASDNMQKCKLDAAKNVDIILKDGWEPEAQGLLGASRHAVDTATPAIYYCYSENLEKIGRKAEQIVNDATFCVDKKIEDATNPDEKPGNSFDF